MTNYAFKINYIPFILLLKKNKRSLEIWGIEPQTSPMLRERSTTELYPHTVTHRGERRQKHVLAGASISRIRKYHLYFLVFKCMRGHSSAYRVLSYGKEGGGFNFP